MGFSITLEVIDKAQRNEPQMLAIQLASGVLRTLTASTCNGHQS